ADLALGFEQLSLGLFVARFGLAQLLLQLLDAVLARVRAHRRGGRGQARLRQRGRDKENPGRDEARREPGLVEKWRRCFRHKLTPRAVPRAKFGRLRDRAADDLRVCVSVHTPRFLVRARIERTLLAVGDGLDAAGLDAER